MKYGSTLQELATELERQSNAKRDFVCSTSVLGIDRQDDAFALDLPTNGDERESFEMADLAHSQVAERTGIPKRYYDRMREEAPDLLLRNVRNWFETQPKGRMVRVLDGRARAFLSNRYRRVDNQEIMSATLPVILQECHDKGHDLTVASCSVTERRMYLKLRFPWIQRNLEAAPGGHRFLRDGDLVEAAITISNSEVGEGGINVVPGVYTHQCTNLMMARALSTRRFHIGRADETEGEVFSDETKEADDRALMLKIRDTVRAAMNSDVFQDITDRLVLAQGDKIVKPQETLELAQKRFVWTNPEAESVLRHLIEGGDLSRYGLLNAVTRTAEDLEDYDRASELEMQGGDLLTTTGAGWGAICPN